MTPLRFITSTKVRIKNCLKYVSNALSQQILECKVKTHDRLLKRWAMKDRHVVGGGLLLAGVLMTGCAAGTSIAGGTACGPEYHCTKDLMFQDRQ